MFAKIKNPTAANIADVNRAKHFADQVYRPFEKFAEENPSLNKIWKAAKDFHGAKKDAFENKIINKIRDKLANEPGAVEKLFYATENNAAIAHDNLVRIREAFEFASGNPKVNIMREPGETMAEFNARLKELPRVQKTISSKTGKGINPVTKTVAQRMYDEQILQPLRTAFLKKSTIDGRLSGTALLAQLESLNKGSKKYLRELFGTETQVKNLEALARVLKEAEATPATSILLQLKTAGAVGAIFSGANWYMGDDPKVGTSVAIGTGTILLGPYVLAKALTNPRLTRQLIDGFSDKPSFVGKMSPKLLKAVRNVAEMKYAANYYKSQPSSNSIQYYLMDDENQTTQAK
jgi:hypothetical protein